MQKIIRALIISCLFLAPVTAFATTLADVGEGSESADQQAEEWLVPAKVISGARLYSDQYGNTDARNQINEMAYVNQVDEKYEVTLQIGSWSALDMLQIVREEYVDSILDEDNSVTQGKLLKLPASVNTMVYKTEIIDQETDYNLNMTRSEEYDSYYYSADEVTIGSPDPLMESNTITITVSDPSKPILIKTYSYLYGVTSRRRRVVVDQIVTLDLENKIQYPGLDTDNYTWSARWMGYWDSYYNESVSGQSRIHLATEGSSFKNAFEDTVDVYQDSEGKYWASLTLKDLDPSEDDYVQKIEVMTSRDVSESFVTENDITSGYILSDFYANYEEVSIEEIDNVRCVNVPIYSLIYGQGMRISTNETISINEKEEYNTDGMRRFNYGFLHIWPSEALENIQLTKEDAETGVLIKYYENDFATQDQIGVEIGTGSTSPTLIESLENFAKDYRSYTFYALDSLGKPTSAETAVEYIVPVPEGWDLDYTFIYLFNNDGSAWPVYPTSYLSEDKKYLQFSNSSASQLNCTLFMYEAERPEDVTALSDGLYRTKITVGNKGNILLASMAHEAFAEKPAYIEVKDGSATLYAEVGGVYINETYGYISNMFYHQNRNLGNGKEVNYLGYWTNDDGHVRITTDNENYMTFDVRRIQLPLENPLSNYAYWVSFYVPIMDGMSGGYPGSGASEQPAYLCLSNFEKVDEGVNPLDGYEISLIEAEAEYLYFSSYTSDWTEAQRTYAKRIRDNTIEAISSGKYTEEDQDSLEYALNAIHDVYNAAMLEEGRYYIPIENELEDSIINKTIYASVLGDNITYRFSVLEGNEISSFSYSDGYSDYQSNVDISQDKTNVSFTLPYTESTIFIQINGTEYEINLDFASAELSSSDLSELRNAIQEAENKLADEVSYTSNTLEDLKEEIENSKTLLDNLDAEQSEVDAQAERLKQAIDNLKEKASDDQLTELSRLKREIAAAINDETYTSASRAELKEFYDELTESTADTDNISTEDYEQYILSIKEAMEKLEEAEDPDDNPGQETGSQLLSLVEDYRSWLDESEFTADSWAEFMEVLDAAESLGQSELTDAQIQEEMDKILEARNELIYRTDYEDQIDELAAYLDEVEAELESEGFPGYIGYDSLVSAIAAADQGIARKAYLSQNQIEALEASVTFHYDALLEEDNLDEEAVNSTLMLEDYIPEVILEEDLQETEAELENFDEENTESPSNSAGEEADAEESAGAAEESTSAAEETTGAAEESTSAAEESTSAAEETTGAAEESTGAAEETTGAAEESASAAEESSSGAEENTEAAEESGLSGSVDTEQSQMDREEEPVKEESAENNEDDTDHTEERSEETDSDEADRETGDQTEDEPDKEENQGLTVASISPHLTYRVMAAASRSGEYKDGTYYVDYDLWKWDDDSLSMGNAALDYGDQLGRMILDDGTWTLYVHFNQLQYDGIVGELKEMKRMVNIKNTSDGLSYGTRNAEYPETIEDYPSVLGFTTSESEEYIPVEVNVPLMTAGPIQVARLIVDWDSLEYINGSTDINSSMDLSSIEDAIDEAESLDEKDYTSWSWKVVEDSRTAAEHMIQNETATQAMIDRRAEALEAAIDALIPVAGSSDKLKLSDALLEAYIIDEADYSSSALLELERARSAAEALEGADDVTSSMIEMAVRDLKEALSRSGTGTGEKPDDSDDTTGVRYSTLQSLIQLLERYESSDYTASSWRNLQAALENAGEVLERAQNGQATQEEIDAQVELLKDVRGDLVYSSGNEGSGGSVNYKYLNSLISRAKTLLSMTGSYTEASLRNLQTEYDLALVMLEDEEATQEDVDEQKENLRSAINALVADAGTDNTGTSGSEDDDTDTSGSNEDEGYYEVDVDLWHATLNKASMGDPAVNKTAYVYIDEDGDITMRLVTKKMTTSGITTHLYDYYYYEDGDYEEAELISSENSKWIFEFPLPNDNDKYYKCKVDPRVDVMGDDPVKARLKVDWDSLDEVDQDDWNDLEGDVDEDDDDDSTYSSSSSTSGNPTLQSGETGIRIYGNVGGPGIVLEVVKKENGPEYDMTHGAISSQVNRFVLYDVRLKSGTGYVQPTSSVTMQIPIPTGYDTSKLVLYRIGEDGSYTTISGKVNGSYYEATVDHFSLYALAESNQVAETAASSERDSSGGSSDGSSSRTRTTSSRTSGSSRTSSSQSSNSDSSGNHVAAGREIPYTGDPMPVKELAGVGFLAAVICLGTVLPDLRRKLESRKQQEE